MPGEVVGPESLHSPAECAGLQGLSGSISGDATIGSPGVGTGLFAAS